MTEHISSSTSEFTDCNSQLSNGIYWILSNEYYSLNTIHRGSFEQSFANSEAERETDHPKESLVKMLKCCFDDVCLHKDLYKGLPL